MRGRLVGAGTLAVVGLVLSTPGSVAGPGTEFLAVFSRDGGILHPLTVIVGNPDPVGTATVTVETEAGVIATALVAPRRTHEFDLGETRALEMTAMRLAGYRIRSDLPVHAYQLNPFDPDSAPGISGGSMLMDVAALGTEHLVMALASNTLNTHPSVVTIVARAATRVEVVPTAATAAGPGVPALAAGVPASFDLTELEVLQLAAVNFGDLTGTEVRSDVPVAVYAGCNWCSLPGTTDDEVQESLLPVSLWSPDALVVTSVATTRDVQRFRILASVDGTTVTTDPVQAGTPARLDRGEFLDLSGSSNFAVVADQPILVGRFVTTGPGAEGDPSLSWMLSPDRFTTGAVFALPNTWPMFYWNWVDLVAAPGTTVRVDGVVVAASAFTPIGSSGYGHAHVRLDLATETHTVEADAPVGIYAGHASFANATTFPAAMALPQNLAPLCDAGGPYEVACTGPETTVDLSGGGSSDPEGQPLSYAWSSSYAGVFFDDPASATPRVAVTGLGTFRVELEVSDGARRASCATTVTTSGDATVPAELDPIGSPLLLVRRGAAVLFQWQDLGGPPMRYNVYEGPIAVPGTHLAYRCGEAGVAVAPGRREVLLTPVGASRYYLMTASNCHAEGPSGADPGLETCPP